MAVGRQGEEAGRLRAWMAAACAERDEALERVRQLEDLLMARDTARVATVGLTREEERVMGVLLRWPVASHEQLMALLYGTRADPPNDGILRVYIHRIRAKLGPRGIVIHTIRGHGWALDAASRARLKEAAA